MDSSKTSERFTVYGNRRKEMQRAVVTAKMNIGMAAITMGK